MATCPDSQAVHTDGPAPVADPSPIFKALHTATTRLPVPKTVVSAASGVCDQPDRHPDVPESSQVRVLRKSLCLPVFKEAQGHTHKKSSLARW